VEQRVELIELELVGQQVGGRAAVHQDRGSEARERAENMVVTRMAPGC
jgi:hypothetical protein